MTEDMLKGITILYVEDDTAIRQNTSVTLKLVSANIIDAVDGRDGLEKYKENIDKIDIVMTDLSMPDMDGLEMISEIKKLKKDTPILITTAHQDLSYLKKAIEFGVTSYIIKPIDIRNIITSILKAIEPVNAKNELLERIESLEEENKSLKKQLEQTSS